MLRRDRHDIVHTQNSKAGVIGRLAATLAGTPVILHTVHDFAFRGAKNRLLAWLLRSIEKYFARMCDVLLFVSQTEQSYAITNHIAPESKTLVVGQGVDLEEFCEGRLPRDVRAVVSRTYGLNPAAPIVGSVARLVPHKGHDCLLRAAAILLKDLPDTQFLIAGGGPEQRPLEELAEKLGIRESIRFTGFLPSREEVLSIFSSLDLFVLPTRKEGFGVVFVEAMASGLPVVAFDIAPVNTIVKHNETGILVPEEDAQALCDGLKHILAHIDIRKSMGMAGRQRAFAEFDLRRPLVRIVDEFDRLSLEQESRNRIAERSLAS
jgi:glycosyltransferase involved in cell wall biosynthesis